MTEPLSGRGRSRDLYGEWLTFPVQPMRHAGLRHQNRGGICRMDALEWLHAERWICQVVYRSRHFVRIAFQIPQQEDR
jgi:hypothetical protein